MKLERGEYDSLADLYSIVMTLEHLERAFVRDSVAPEEYDKVSSLCLCVSGGVASVCIPPLPCAWSCLCPQGVLCECGIAEVRGLPGPAMPFAQPLRLAHHLPPPKAMSIGGPDRRTGTLRKAVSGVCAQAQAAAATTGPTTCHCARNTWAAVDSPRHARGRAQPPDHHRIRSAL